MDELIKKYLNSQIDNEIIKLGNTLLFESDYVKTNYKIFNLTEKEFSDIAFNYFGDELGFVTIFLNPTTILDLIEFEIIPIDDLKKLLNYVTNKKLRAITEQKYEKATKYRDIEKKLIKKTSELEV